MVLAFLYRLGAVMYYIYMLRCENNSLYTGITTDVNRRISEHLGENDGGAKYTRSNRVKSLEMLLKTDTRQSASKLEYHLKTLTKEQKEKLILDNSLLEKILGEKVDTSKYKAVKI